MFLKNIITKYNLTQILLLVLALVVPLEKTTMRILLVAITFSTLIQGKYNIFNQNRSWIKFILSLLWLLPFIQLIILNGASDHWSHLETKLSLLLFPIFLLIGVDIKKEFIYDLLKFFIIGCCISIIICLLNASYNFFILEKNNSFYYKNISIFHHPSYFSMYLNFAIGLLYLNLVSPISKHKIKNKWSWILIISFTVFIVLVSSRTGWISNFLINSIFIIVLIKRKFFHKRHLLLGLVILLTIGGLVNFSPSLKNRFNEIIKHTVYAKQQSNYPSSTSTRIKAWESAAELIQKNWLFGLGSGIGSVELNKVYEAKGYLSLKEKNTNTHNQYLQYLLDHGVVGLIFLVFFTIIMFFNSFKDKYYLYALFLIIMMINFMTESMLETQSGIVFFAFFNTLFFYHWLDNKPTIN
jgi:O-antigen ligase